MAARRRPTRAQTRSERRRALLVRRMGRAQTPAERLGVAYGYARAAIADLPPHLSQTLADELVDTIVAAADRVIKRQKGPRS